MNVLKIEYPGLPVLPRYLSRLPRQVGVRPIKGGYVIASDGQIEARDAPQFMVERLGQAATPA